MSAIFHPDELAAQALAGQSSSGAGIRPAMPDQHRDFFGLLPYLFVATTDVRGAPMASVLTGPVGFVRSPAPTTLRIDALAAPEDPAASTFYDGSPIGLLGLDLTTRRRNRANGRVTALDTRGLTVAIDQSFGNCAQYIQTRRPTPLSRIGTAAEELARLDPAARSTIAGADTFFVASRSRADIAEAGGLDMSHRGGRPGFVGLEGDTLVVPDFRGNRFFNTLGNLLGDPRAALLFIDFASGDLLQLQGKVAIDWSPDRAAAVAGAQRLWRFAVERAWRRPAALPFDWTFDAYAPTTLATGVWAGGAAATS